MKEDIVKAVTTACRELFAADVRVELTRPDEQFGDYATNVALQLAKQLGKKPREVAEQLAGALTTSLVEQVREVTVAGPGFLNFRLTDAALIVAAQTQPAAVYQGKTMVTEYSDPNPFKVLHAGHLYTTVVGDVISRLLEQAGATVHRVNYGGDVGLHVGKAMWAILQELGGEHPEGLQNVNPTTRLEWLSACYIKGNQAYEDDEAAKAEIIAINQRVYQVHAENDQNSPFAEIYWTCRRWSYRGFDEFYERLQVTKFERYIPESESTPVGLEVVSEGLKQGIFKVSDGAIIFEGEDHGLHTRVFVNSKGLPTYEAKDLGLAAIKWRDYHFDLGVIITGNEIVEYMKVVLKALEHFYPEIVARSRHFTHGMVKLPGGVKMSSRLGNVLRAEDILEIAREANRQATGNDDENTVLGAVKYAFLKNRIGGDIIYDPEESVSLEGNSGPYLQYAHARARSILRKADSNGQLAGELDEGERALLRKISEYSEVVDKAVAELLPHHICTYLYELAQIFNRFYEKNRVLGSVREATRLALVAAYAERLHQGLHILGIVAPEKM